MKQIVKEERITEILIIFKGKFISVILRSNIKLILYFDIDVKEIIQLGKKYKWPHPERCPCCGSKKLWGHGYVARYFSGYSSIIWVKRCRCPVCKSIITCRPRGYWRGFNYSIRDILGCMLKKLKENKWSRAISRQSQQYWYKGLCIQGSRYYNHSPPNISTLRDLLIEHILPVSHSIQLSRLGIYI